MTPRSQDSTRVGLILGVSDDIEVVDGEPEGGEYKGVLRLPASLHKRLKVAAAKNEHSMKAAIIEAIEAWLEPKDLPALKAFDLSEIPPERRALVDQLLRVFEGEPRNKTHARDRRHIEEILADYSDK